MGKPLAQIRFDFTTEDPSTAPATVEQPVPKSPEKKKKLLLAKKPRQGEDDR